MPQSCLVSSLRRIAGILLVTLACLLAPPALGMAQPPTVLAMRIDGTITPVIADHLEEGLRTAVRDGKATPGRSTCASAYAAGNGYSGNSPGRPPSVGSSNRHGGTISCPVGVHQRMLTTTPTAAAPVPTSHLTNALRPATP